MRDFHVPFFATGALHCTRHGVFNQSMTSHTHTTNRLPLYISPSLSVSSGSLLQVLVLFLALLLLAVVEREEPAFFERLARRRADVLEAIGSQ